MKIIDFIENNLVNTSGPMHGKKIKLAEWEKDTLEKLGDDFFGSGKRDIKRIIIVGKRKNGITMFCKWLHWLKVGGNGSYVISHNKEFSTLIKKKPIMLSLEASIKEKQLLGIDWMQPISIHQVKEHGLEPIKENKYMKVINFIMKVIDDDPELHVMLDLPNFDKDTIDLIDSQKPDFVTISISNDRLFENKEMMEWLSNEKTKKDTLVTIINDNKIWMNYYD